MRSIKEKKERSLGTKLFLKGDRCNSPKCVSVRRPQRPGQHGVKRQRTPSDFGRQLQEKQKIQFYFGLSNHQMERIFGGAREKIETTLRQRLDFVVFALGFAKAPRIARQMVSHGHILVNGRKVTVPSFHVTTGDVIEVRPESRDSKLFEGIRDRLKTAEMPKWLKLDVENLKGECIGSSSSADERFPFDVNLVGQYYSR